MTNFDQFHEEVVKRMLESERGGFIYSFVGMNSTEILSKYIKSQPLRPIIIIASKLTVGAWTNIFSREEAMFVGMAKPKLDRPIIFIVDSILSRAADLLVSINPKILVEQEPHKHYRNNKYGEALKKLAAVADITWVMAYNKDLISIIPKFIISSMVDAVDIGAKFLK